MTLCAVWSPPRPARLRATSPERTGIEARIYLRARLGKAQMQTFWMPFRGNCIGLVVVDEASMVSLEMLSASSTVFAGIAALPCSATRISCCPSGQETSSPTSDARRPSICLQQ